MRIPGRNFHVPVEAPVVYDDDSNPGSISLEKATNRGHDRVGETAPIETFTPNAQPGVLAIEATTTIWTPKGLYIIYAMLWLVFFVDALQQQMANNFTPYIASRFQGHSLTGYIGSMSGIIGGVFQIPLAKILDIFGRPQGFALTVFFLLLGMVMMAVCHSVQTYATAQVFYWLGFNGLTYTLGIFFADTSSLQNRGFMFAYMTSPYLITVWIAGPLSQVFESGDPTAVTKGIGFRVAFGIMIAITVLVSIPPYLTLLHYHKKAIKAGLISQAKSNYTFKQSVRYYAIEFDVGGLILLSVGLVTLMLPLNLYSRFPGQWRSPVVQSLLISGGILLVAFVLYEKYMAPKSFVPWKLLTDRTILGACILSALLFISYYIWHSYFGSFLQVVNGLSLAHSSYVLNIYSVGSCLFSLVVGLAIRYTGYFKWITLYFGVPVTILGVGLMIQFRQPDTPLAMVVFPQVLIAFAGGACVITKQIAVMAATDHQYIATVLALEAMFFMIGGGIGSSIGTAIWNSVYPKKLTEYLPPDAMKYHFNITQDFKFQLGYPKGNETRIAIERAYGDAQKWMNIAGTAVLGLGIFAVMVWRNIRVADFKQVKGHVA